MRVLNRKFAYFAGWSRSDKKALGKRDQVCLYDSNMNNFHVSVITSRRCYGQLPCLAELPTGREGLFTIGHLYSLASQSERSICDILRFLMVNGITCFFGFHTLHWSCCQWKLALFSEPSMFVRLSWLFWRISDCQMTDNEKRTEKQAKIIFQLSWC